jgi:hypothetical protein
MVLDSRALGIKTPPQRSALMTTLRLGEEQEGGMLIPLSKHVSLQTHSSTELLSCHILALTFVELSLPTIESMFPYTPRAGPLIIAIR